MQTRESDNARADRLAESIRVIFEMTPGYKHTVVHELSEPLIALHNGIQSALQLFRASSERVPVLDFRFALGALLAGTKQQCLEPSET